MSDPEAPGSQQAIARTFLENGFNLTQLAGLQDVDETKRYFKDRTRLKPTLKFAITVIRAIGPDFYFDPLWLVLAYTLRTKEALKQIPDAPIVQLARRWSSLSSWRQVHSRGIIRLGCSSMSTLTTSARLSPTSR